MTTATRASADRNVGKILAALSRLLLIILLSATMAGCAAIARPKSIPAVPQSQSFPPPPDLRDFRYCEIIPVFQTRLTFHVEVYNTMGLSDCPADLWAKVDAASIAKEHDAKVVKLNGPRYWVLNRIVGGGATAAGKIVDFGGIEMKLLAVLETKLWEGTVGDAFYTPNEVQRTTTFSYWAGNMVYELLSPEGDVYRMQSYAQIVDPTLTIADLETLGERLDLPEGWRYETRILAEDSELKASGLAYVINDDLLNSYQKVMQND
jgi:hypothetical protein